MRATCTRTKNISCLDENSTWMSNSPVAHAHHAPFKRNSSSHIYNLLVVTFIV